MDEVTSRSIAVAAHKQWSRPARPGPRPWCWRRAPGRRPRPIVEVEIARVEAGLLRYGQDVDEDAFPFETPLAAFLDYGKGCYVGQEPVFRVHAQGQGARVLRGLRVDGDGAVS
ncbi:MAG: hypothetical protein HS111_22775 [Kofleriaceae bacterium]|nr:hypothetical protein [Kofleriaceae bacterium]